MRCRQTPFTRKSCMRCWLVFVLVMFSLFVRSTEAAISPIITGLAEGYCSAEVQDCDKTFRFS